jgi:hypothetical protein
MANSTRELSTPRIFRRYGTIKVDATTASGTTAVALVLDTNATSEQPIIRIAVPNAVAVRVELGGSSVATGTASPIYGGSSVEFEDRGTNTHVAIATISGTSDNVTVTTGEGLGVGF